MSLWRRAVAPARHSFSQQWRAPGAGSMQLGSVRTKKWKPFHSMYVPLHKRKEYDPTAEAEKAEIAGSDSSMASRSVPAIPLEEPKVLSSPFQATRLMRAFSVLAEPDAKITFETTLNVDLQRESVRGVCHLPHGLSTKLKLLVFCEDWEAEQMIAAGADFAGITDPIKRLNTGWIAFDRCIATPSMMPQVMKVAKILGPRKLMPNPKSGTVVTNLMQAIKDAKSGTLLEYRAVGAGTISVVMGDESFSDAKVLDNIKFFVSTLLKTKPKSSAATGEGPTTPLIPGLKGKTIGKGSDDSKKTQDSYFLEAALQMGVGPLIPLDTNMILPTSVGYFR